MNKELNVLTLAYIGDSIYEVYIREYLIKQNIVKVKQLSETAKKYVSAKGQASYLKQLIDANFLTKEELDIAYRARNHKSHASKSTDIITYKHSTSLEAIIGYLYLENKYDRIKEIMDRIVKI